MIENIVRETEKDVNQFLMIEYGKTLVREGIPENERLWYIACVERFAKYLKGKQLVTVDAKDAEAYIFALGTRPEIKKWKIRVAEKAIRIF